MIIIRSFVEQQADNSFYFEIFDHPSIEQQEGNPRIVITTAEELISFFEEIELAPEHIPS